MKLSKELKGRLVVIIVAIVLACGMFAANYFLQKPGGKVSLDGGEKTVTLKIKYANFEYTYENLDASDVNTVLELLEKYNDQLDLGLKYTTDNMGAFITELKGTPNNNQKGYFYTYTINGHFADGISIQTLSDGDIIEFKYLFEEWQEVDGEWLLKESKLINGKYDKTFIFALIVPSVIIIVAVLYILNTFIKSKSKNEEK